MTHPVAPAMPEAPIPDADLVREARRGRDEALDALARRLREPAYTLALQLLRDPEDAMDVAQEALLRFFRQLHRVDPDRSPRPWLAAIVRNRVRDVLRRRRVRRSESLEALTEGGRPEPVSQLEDPAHRALRRDLQRRIWRALGELSEGQREILVLRDYQDLSYAEIARVLHVPVGTVMSRLHRARKALKDRLERRADVDA